MKKVLFILFWLSLAFVVMGQTRQMLEQRPNVQKTEANGLTIYIDYNYEIWVIFVFADNTLVGTGVSPSDKASIILKHIEDTCIFLRAVNFNNALYFDPVTKELLLVSPLYTETGLRFFIIKLKEDLWK